jgi:hypothetical protein
VTTPASPQVCTSEAAEQAFAQTWSPERRAALEQHLGEIGSYGPSLLLHIDAWSSDWRSEWIDACEAMLDRKLQCLERQRLRGAASIDALMGSNADSIAGSVQALERHIRLDDCR